jgi:glucose-6-phosphate 1-dehydrogenase
MQIWKFLLLGVTGDLAKKKILPALAQFAELNQEKAHIQLIGYSRSTPDTREIEKILNQNSTSQTHCLSHISYVQGEYSDSQILAKLINTLEPNERLVTYLAVPPSVYVKFLQNSCPYTDKEIDIIIEKPFGQNTVEAQQILDVVNECSLSHKVHFVDHYLFKNAARMNKVEINNFKLLKNLTPSSIQIQALEEVGVKDRGGYYDTFGATKDMLTHLYSLLLLNLQLLTSQNSPTFSIDPHSLLLGQYESYLDDVDLTYSQTDSYFKVNGILNLPGESCEISLESGKKLGIKRTWITTTFQDPATKLTWKIAPEQEIVFESPEQSFVLNLKKNNKMDHTNMFEDVMERDFSRFIPKEKILEIWETTTSVFRLKDYHIVRPIRYKNGVWPVEEINPKARA